MAATGILIDQREPAWVQGLSFGGIPVAVTLLEYGDVHVATDDGALLAIERKTPNDLLNSLRDDRLWVQLAGLRRLTPWAYLVITGQLHRSSDGHVVTENVSLIDLVVSVILMSLGMMMMPPVVVSTPLKLLLFVLVDGWELLVRALSLSFE